MVSWGNGYPSTLSQWRYEFDSRWDRTQKREIKMPSLFSLTVIDVISAVKIYNAPPKSPL